MKKITNIIIFVLSLSTMTTAFAADTKINGRLYADWNLNMTNGAESANSFNVGRAYVTVKSKLSEFTSVRITSDIRSTDAFDGYSIILKYGYFDWKPSFERKKLKVRIGLQPTLFIDNINKLWGRRYLEKTVGDKNKFLTSSDLGLAMFVNLDDKGKAGYVSLQVFNGTSYTKVEEMNKYKDFTAFALLKPFSNSDNINRSILLAQVYLGTQNVSLVQGEDTTITGKNKKSSQYNNQILSVGGMFGYKHNFDLGFDANFQTKGQGYNDSTGVELGDKKSIGLSFFGTLYLKGMTESDSFGHTLNLFGRYDILDPYTDVDNDGKSLMIVGIESIATKGFKVSLNFRKVSYESNGKDSEAHIFLNTLIKF